MKTNVGVCLSTIGVILVLGLAGCISGASTPMNHATPTNTGTVQTLASQVEPSATIQVALTIPAASKTPPATASHTPNPPASTPIPTFTPSPTSPCDRAAAGNPIDVTIPDDTLLYPGESFTKIWRLHNVGLCTWTRDYAARFFYGNQMEAPDMVFLSADVLPGETIEISVDMVAPLQPGLYQGYWMLRNADGALFGIGPGGDLPFWVRIVVTQPETATPAASATLAASATPTMTSTPSPTPTATAEALSSGAVILNLNDSLDLDSGTLNQLSEDDILFRLDVNSFHLLVPLNGAQMGITGTSEPSPVVCQEANMSTALLTLESLPNPFYLCYRTSEGRLGWLRYDGLAEGGEQVSLFHQTWLQP
jgi:hypothetical protein